MRLGVLGSMVWDLIDHPDAPRVERWGGIAYSLAAGSAALPDGWTIRPLVKVGSDLADRAAAFVGSLPHIEGTDHLVPVAEPNNRVHLRYVDRHHRHECLTGGVPGWSWAELEPRIEGLDALYVNLISGFELDLDVARALRDRFQGPIYGDLHSLLLGPAVDDGPRTPRPLDRRDEWLACFDVIQANEVELALVAGEDDPWAVGREAATRGAAVLITLGPRGATWIAGSDSARPWGDAVSEPLTRTVPVETSWPNGDPTGCGDVWGVTCFIELLRGRRVSEAVAAANRAAALNATHRGAEGLYEHLRGSA